ncbi:FMN-binding split barrel-related protein [Penicillium capsulatum]|nr:FMN-binding split barrel-related protein [Penicillium capsulatum]
MQVLRTDHRRADVTDNLISTTLLQLFGHFSTVVVSNLPCNLARPCPQWPLQAILAPPWRDLLTSHLNQTPGYDFTIATVGYDPQGRPVPRVRTCGCRGFFPELKLHPSGQKDMEQQVEDGGNPACYESDMLTFTTDTRMEKLPQLDSSGHAVEGMFWLKDLMVQWRIKGRAFAIGSPIGTKHDGEKVSREEIGNGLRVKGGLDGDAEKWTWERAVTKYFANHSPAMRGSFKTPSPGQPRSQAPSNPALGVGQKVTDLHDPIAREHFRVVVIVPEEVEYLDLSDEANLKRWRWTLAELAENNEPSDKPGSHWLEIELWP